RLCRWPGDGGHRRGCADPCWRGPDHCRTGSLPIQQAQADSRNVQLSPRMTARYIAAIDQGTTSSRCIVFDAKGLIVASAQKEHRQIFPRPGWVEHDASEIWANVSGVTAAALAKLGIGPSDLAAVGITNQRETTVLWEKA